MQIEYFIKGLTIGFSIAMPVGPIGIVCISRTLKDGWGSGLTSGFGAATADMLYSGIAAFGFRVVQEFLLDQQIWIRLLGGLFLTFLGIRIIFSTLKAVEIPSSSRGLLGAYLSTLVLTLSNPMTILSFGAVFTGFDLIHEGIRYSDSILMLIGVFLGSCLWWFILSGGVSILRTRFNDSLLKWVNRLSGGVIVAFGIFIILSVIKF
jgi:threonine/homoserine/homoserine lactone efflux protein